jgi:hypothetical protein
MDGQPKTLQEVHGDIEAALFAAQDLDASHEKELIVAELEEALMWCKRGIEKERA